MPKARIEEAAAQKQARIDKGEEVIVGVNKYQPQCEDPWWRCAISTMTRYARLRSRRLNRIRKSRDSRRVAMPHLEHSRCRANPATGNILEAAVEAARARATVGEISPGMENAWGRHTADIITIEGVYEDG